MGSAGQGLSPTTELEDVVAKKKAEILVHPSAAVLPMLEDEALAELAEDIRINGLRHPIVLLPDGTLLDGRNRLAACELIGVTPETVVYDGDDPGGFVLSENVHRRHLTRGQQAMAVALVLQSIQKIQRGAAAKAAQESGVPKQRVSHALTVIDHAPEMVDAVMSGAMGLNGAYDTAQERKAAIDASEKAVLVEARRLDVLRRSDQALADQVEEERLSLTEAEAVWRGRKQAAEEMANARREAERQTDVSVCSSLYRIAEWEPDTVQDFVEAHDDKNWPMSVDHLKRAAVTLQLMINGWDAR